MKEIDETLEFDIKLNYYQDASIVQIIPIRVEFIENLLEIITAYDFEISLTQDSKPSEYRWIAYRTEDNDNSSAMIKISQHIQETGELPSDEEDIRNRRKNCNYVLKNIIVNETSCIDYSKALHICEEIVREWLTKRGIDLEPYGPAIW